MEHQTPRVHSFAEAVVSTHTPGEHQLTSGLLDSVSGNSSGSSARRAQTNKHCCGVCYFWSRSVADMASHPHTTEDGAPADEECIGAPAFRNSYAHAIQQCVQTGDGWPDDVLADGGAHCTHLEFPEHIGSPTPSGASSTTLPGLQAADTVAGRSGTGALALPPLADHACAASMSDIMARLWQSTNTDNLGDILTPCPPH